MGERSGGTLSVRGAQADTEHPVDVPGGRAGAPAGVWGAVVATLLVTVAAGTLGYAGAIAWQFVNLGGASGGPLASGQWRDGPTFLVYAATTQIIAVLLVVYIASRSSGRSSAGVGMARPAVKLWTLPVVGVATAALSLFLIVVTIAADLGAGDPVPSALLAGMRGGQAVVTLVSVALLPALGEELLFRGYLQRRLVERLGPVMGISLASGLFALCHGRMALQVLPLGVALGVGAWWSQSTWVAVACHAINNGVGLIALWSLEPSKLTPGWTLSRVATATACIGVVVVALVVIRVAERRDSGLMIVSGA